MTELLESMLELFVTLSSAFMQYMKFSESRTCFKLEQDRDMTSFFLPVIIIVWMEYFHLSKLGICKKIENQPIIIYLFFCHFKVFFKALLVTP